eukprot:GHVU01078463.1.p1 GENE.GHVU01078463.1~~GHVU01078463.1.p1  ORF type:complete len:519 (+),score=77.81 GHVU01078463.1:384-1940(+)
MALHGVALRADSDIYELWSEPEAQEKPIEERINFTEHSDKLYCHRLERSYALLDACIYLIFVVFTVMAVILLLQPAIQHSTSQAAIREIEGVNCSIWFHELPFWSLSSPAEAVAWLQRAIAPVVAMGVVGNHNRLVLAQLSVQTGQLRNTSNARWAQYIPAERGPPDDKGVLKWRMFDDASSDIADWSTNLTNGLLVGTSVRELDLKLIAINANSNSILDLAYHLSFDAFGGVQISRRRLFGVPVEPGSFASAAPLALSILFTLTVYVYWILEIVAWRKPCVDATTIRLMDEHHRLKGGSKQNCCSWYFRWRYACFFSQLCLTALMVAVTYLCFGLSSVDANTDDNSGDSAIEAYTGTLERYCIVNVVLVVLGGIAMSFQALRVLVQLRDVHPDFRALSTAIFAPFNAAFGLFLYYFLTVYGWAGSNVVTMGVENMTRFNNFASSIYETIRMTLGVDHWRSAYESSASSTAVGVYAVNLFFIVFAIIPIATASVLAVYGRTTNTLSREESDGRRRDTR